jgi:hypothetical protein
VSPSTDETPYVKTSSIGRVGGAIKPAAQCKGVSCGDVATCIDAADSNRDGLIGVGDSAMCAPPPKR